MSRDTICAYRGKRWATRRSCAPTDPFSCRCNFYTITHSFWIESTNTLPFNRPAVFFPSSCSKPSLRPATADRAAVTFQPGLQLSLFQETGNTRRRHVVLSPFLPPVLTPISRSASFSAKDLIVLSQDWMHFRPLWFLHCLPHCLMLNTNPLFLSCLSLIPWPLTISPSCSEAINGYLLAFLIFKVLQPTF